MANILLTAKCNRSCPYCFAEREMVESSPDDRISWENLIHLADFLQKSGEKHISLLGGEPTLHPHFVDFVLYLIERDFRVTVFTNGILSESRLVEVKEHFTVLSTNQLHFVCNLNEPDDASASTPEMECICVFLSCMGPWTQAGFNIYRTKFHLEFLFDLICRYKLSRYLRLGIAQPMPGRDRGFIHPEGVGAVIARLYSYRESLERLRIKPTFDCGVPLCKFTDEQLGWLFRLGGRPRFYCTPAIDIAPDMSVYSCFPLARFCRKSIFDFDSLAEVRTYYERIHLEVRKEAIGIYYQCDQCAQQKERLCSGGGTCHILCQLLARLPDGGREIERELQNIRLPS